MQEYFMSLALKEAQKAFDRGEVPVGAVIVKDGQVIAKARNERESKQNIVCHAEMLALQKACKKLGTTHLEGCEMYITLEPCPMCSGALVAARLDKVCFGASDLSYGCGGSVYNFFDEPKFEGRTAVYSGILEEKAKKMLQDFFKIVRERNKAKTLIGKKLESTNVLAIDKKKNHFLSKIINNAKQNEIVDFDVKTAGGAPILSFGEGEIVAVIQSLDSFEYVLVEGGILVDWCERLKSVLAGLKCKIITKKHKVVLK